ncbi:MAG: 1-acyl-sn-glycerol-3-phosphate acyltransferase [Desulfosarcinaceae bacterium]|nr:1-acyl-sn-glycerol-3-phosphate acyltransferase [Desulfosarcinaceae bacterium]
MAPSKLPQLPAAFCGHFLSIGSTGMAGTILGHLFGAVALNRAQSQIIRELPPDAVVVYVSKISSNLEWFGAAYAHGRAGIPAPLWALNQTSILLQTWRVRGHMLRHGLARFWRWVSRRPPAIDRDLTNWLPKDVGALFCSLLDKNEFYRLRVKEQPDPLRQLLSWQKRTRRSVYLVPQLLLFSKRPSSEAPRFLDLIFGPPHRPGRLRRLYALLFRSRSVTMEFSDPIDLERIQRKAAAAAWSKDRCALELRRRLFATLNRHRASITGPVLKTHEELQQRLLSSSRMQRFLKRWARRRNLPMGKVYQEAMGYVDEIAARIDPKVIGVGRILAPLLLERIFDGLSVQPEGLRPVKQAAQKGPLIFVPCHRSNLDSLVLAYALVQQHLPSPHFFAGRNLAFWPIGGLLRRFGAFFVRRSFKGAVFYATVFAEYIHTLLASGFNIGVFIEGGRSRTGRLLAPKLGMLTILINALRNGACEDLAFVPVYLGYDRVPEEGAYLHETRGGEKSPENFQQLIRARKLLRSRYGRIYVRFGQPIQFSDLRQAAGLEGTRLTGKAAGALCRRIAEHTLCRINRLTVVSAQGLVAAALLNAPAKGLTLDALHEQVDVYLNYLFSQGVELADTLMLDRRHAIGFVLDDFLRQKWVRRRYRGEADARTMTEARYRVRSGRRQMLEYYKNGCLPVLLPAAVTALAVLVRDTFQFTAEDLPPVMTDIEVRLSDEFPPDVDRSPNWRLRKTLKAFMDEAIMMPHAHLPDTYRLTAEGRRRLVLLAGLLKPLLESYWITVSAHLQAVSKNGHRNLNVTAKQIHQTGKRLFKLGRIDGIEALSRPIFQSAAGHYQDRLKDQADPVAFLQAEARGLERLLSHIS